MGCSATRPVPGGSDHSMSSSDDCRDRWRYGLRNFDAEGVCCVEDRLGADADERDADYQRHKGDQGQDSVDVVARRTSDFGHEVFLLLWQ